ncbi:hypothetical protein D9619_000507 [Psilocybe cf. subviscida]|uniref:Uncharacterized protein n=1 Tax=Psilocybe cf. subviscida TaxID=2480587 RepID=A0A8H5BFB5_9AGAR|nr:hypothetical protein D9619_000507 [Psilocybe cf. subviscida]
MSMHSSSELANALNPNVSQDHRTAYLQHYSPNYAQSFSVAQNLLHNHEQQQQHLHPIADTSAQVQYTQPQYLEQQQQDSQTELQNTSTLVSHENLYSRSTQTHVYNGQQAFSASQEQQLQAQLPQAQQQQLHDQQQYYDASQTQCQPSANLQDPYSASPSQIHHQYTANFGDAPSSSLAAAPNNSSLANYATPTTSYTAPTTTPIAQNVQTTSRYPQYPSPRSAHTTPYVQHPQVSVRGVANAQPAASSSLSADISQDGVYREAPPPAVGTPAVTDPYLAATHDNSSREEASCDGTNMLPTPALEPRRKTPAVQPLVQQQTDQQPCPSQANEFSSTISTPSAPASNPAPASLHRHRQQQQHPSASRATDRMVQALPLFMMETFKVIRKEKDANEEERKRRAAWEEAHEERQSRSEAELAAQQEKLDAMEERLAKREEEQARRDEELARKDEELVKRDEGLSQEKEEVKERLKDVENKMAEMRAMIEALEAARVAAVALPAPTPVVVQPSSSPAVAPPVLIPVLTPIADQPTADCTSLPDNEQNFVENSPQLRLDSPEPFIMSPDLDPVDEEPDLPPVSSISVPRAQEGRQPVASISSSQPLHPNMAAPIMYHLPMPPHHPHQHAPTPSAYHFPTPTPYYPYHPPFPPNYDIPRPALPSHASSTSQLSEFNNQHAAAQYITPNLTPDLVPATVVRAPPPPEQVVAAQRKRKAKSKHQQKKKKRKKRATDDDSEGSGSEFASEDEDSEEEESDVDIEPRRPPKRTNGHDKKIYTLPHALRAHMYSMMEIISDKELPDSHDESTVYHPSQPVRFVWEKTCKQSVHNARMKLLVLEDIKEKRARLYPKVPAEEFSSKAVLERKFDNVFETMRGKYKAQRSEELAQKEREKEARKARNSRHSARKTAKLSDRSETRLKMPKYEPVVFDPALLRECMSSDESDVEVDPATQVKVDICRSRGPAWRSGRLVNFYKVLEDNKVVDPNVRPKGGVGKKRPRRAGPPKAEFILPPKGVAPWMVSRRWVEKARKTYADLDSVLGKLVADEYVLDGEMYEELGDESEVDDGGEAEMETDVPPVQDQPQLPIQGAQMHTLRLGLQPQQLEVGPAFSGRYTL